MKKTLALILFSLSFLAISAQTNKGKMFIGGNLNYSTNKNSTSYYIYNQEQKNSSTSVSPYVGYFIQNDWALGALLDINNQKTETTSNSYTDGYQEETTTTDHSGIGVFITKYFTISDRLKFDISANVCYQSVSQKNNSSTNNTSQYSTKLNYKGSSADLTFGLMYFITPKLGIHANLADLSFISLSGKEQSDSNLKSELSESNLNWLGSSLMLGLQYHF